jgi:dTDP-4-dehydrorhamnose 3,5-epimerase
MTHVAAAAPRIQGVQVKQLRVIPDERGWLMEILRRDETELLPQFGQVYVSATYPGVVKACKGAVNEFFVGAQNPLLVQVPNLVYHGWKCISSDLALVVNVPSEPYDRESPDEYRLEPHGTLAYDWTRKDG